MQRDVPHRCYGMTLGTDRNTALGCGSGTQNRTSHQSLHRRASSTPATTNADYARAEMPTIFSMMSLPSLPTSNLVRTECSLGDDHRHRHTGHDHALRIRAFGHHTGSRYAGNPFGVLSWLRSASLHLTVLAFDLGMGGWMLLLYYTETMPPATDAAFWMLMQIGIVLGVVTGYPVVRRLQRHRNTPA